MNNNERKAVASIADLDEGGKGVRFDVRNAAGDLIPAFVVCFDGQYFAYLNQCGHIAIQLDYMPGEFFSDDGRTLICATHGAEYAPDSGACLGGPCYGVGLTPIEIVQENQHLYLKNEEYTLVV